MKKIIIIAIINLFFALTIQREHIYDYFPNISAKNILHLYDISSYGKEKLN
jgi:hypothetical protein